MNDTFLRASVYHLYKYRITKVISGFWLLLAIIVIQHI